MCYDGTEAIKAFQQSNYCYDESREFQGARVGFLLLLLLLLPLDKAINGNNDISWHKKQG